MRVVGRGYRDGVRNLEVMVESLSGGSRPEIQEEGRVMELKIFLFKYSRRLWREAIHYTFETLYTQQLYNSVKTTFTSTIIEDFSRTSFGCSGG